MVPQDCIIVHLRLLGSHRCFIFFLQNKSQRCGKSSASFESFVFLFIGPSDERYIYSPEGAGAVVAAHPVQRRRDSKGAEARALAAPLNPALICLLGGFFLRVEELESEHVRFPSPWIQDGGGTAGQTIPCRTTTFLLASFSFRLDFASPNFLSQFGFVLGFISMHSEHKGYRLWPLTSQRPSPKLCHCWAGEKVSASLPTIDLRIHTYPYSPVGSNMGVR